eukprot:s559_g20.t1
MSRLQKRASLLRRRGLFRAATGIDVSWGLGRVFSTPTDQAEDQMRFHYTAKVNYVDIFVSHSWSANGWLKYLAVCCFLNLGIAKKATAAAAVFSSLLVFLVPELPTMLVFCMMLDVPVLVFLVFFLYGQNLTCGLWCPSMWVDKLCVDQGDESRKAAGLAGLPTIVQCSGRMLVLWDDTYFERLWCNFELAVFAKYRGLKNFRFLPVWLPPWILIGVLFSYLLWRLIATLQELDPEYGIDDTAKYTTAHGDKVAFGTQRVLKILSDLETYAVLEMPFFAAAVALLRSKLDGHRSLLENMMNFDIQLAKCSVEDDREVIEAQVARLYAIAEEPVIALDSLDGLRAAEAVSSIPLSPRSSEESVIGDSFLAEQAEGDGEGYARILAEADKSQMSQRGVSSMHSESVFEYPVRTVNSSTVASRAEGYTREISEFAASSITNSSILAPVAAAVSDAGSDYPLMGVDMLAWETDIEGKVCLSQPDEGRLALQRDVDREDCLQVFNELVRSPLRAAIVEELGLETDLPVGDCLIVYMPAVLAATAITWAARGLYAGLGFSSVSQYLFVNLTQTSLALFCNPLAYALLLQGMNCITPTVSAGLLRGLMCLGCGVLAKIFVCALYAVICGTLESYVLTQHPIFLVGFLASLSCALVLNWIFFWAGRPAAPLYS